jgi:hypothetical protein
MPHYEKWIVDNAISYLRYVLIIQYPDLITEPNCRIDLTRDNWPTITISGHRRTFTNNLSCNLNLEGEPDIIHLDTTRLATSDRWVSYDLEIIVKGLAVEKLVKAAMRYACYCLNTPDEMNCYANSLQEWDAIYGVNEAKQITCRLIIAQKPKPTTIETDKEANARRKIIVNDIEKLWNIITGSEYTQGINVYDQCRLSGRLERKKEEGIGLHLIYRNFSLLSLQPDINSQLEAAKKLIAGSKSPIKPLALSPTLSKAPLTSTTAAPPIDSRKRGNIEPLDLPPSSKKPSGINVLPAVSIALQPKPLPPRAYTLSKPSAPSALNNKPPTSLGSAPTMYKKPPQGQSSNNLRATGSSRAKLPAMPSEQLKGSVDLIVQDMKTNREPKRQEREDTSTWFNSPPRNKPK